ncbi:MAG: RNA polymerase sigma factor [Planctomycetales bacterium]|nr:RNA polymerase sigma factor [Planctomycetales bacterium]
MANDDHNSIYSTWLEQHTAAVLKVARAYTLAPEECQDLAQEILLQAWRSLPKFQGDASPATWFYRIALHTAMNWRRNDAIRRTRQVPLLDIDPVADDDGAAQSSVEQKETIAQLYKAIHRLPKADAALILLYLDQLTYREMAAVLGISESNVGVKLNRVKKALTALMNEGSHGT